MILTHIAPAPLFAVAEFHRANRQAEPVFHHVVAVTHTRAEADRLAGLLCEQVGTGPRLPTYRVDQAPLYDVVIEHDTQTAP